jgi:outer membrane protein TolC
LVVKKLAEIEAQKKAQSMLSRDLNELESDLPLPARSILREQLAVQNSKASQHRELLLEEMKLAEQQLQYTRKRFAVGVDTQEEFLRATRDLYSTKRELARLDGDKAQLLSIAQEQMKLTEEQLKQILKRIQIGNLSLDSEIELRKELLRLRREILDLQ